MQETVDEGIKARLLEGGKLAGEEILAGNGGGIGLINVQSRLHATFGPDYGLEIDSELGRGTTVMSRSW